MARACGIALPAGAPLLLALGTWLVYVADRLLDGLPGAHAAHLRARHHFYARHRLPFLILGATGALLLLWLVFTRMAPLVRREDTAVFLVALVYFILVHTQSAAVEGLLSKELAVGALFATATAVPVWARLGSAHTALVPLVVLFAALCWLNCAAINKWEQPLDAPLRFAERHLPLVCGILAAVAIVLAAGSHSSRHLLLALAAAAALLALLDRSHTKLSPMFLRVAADAALLTPLLILPWLR